MSISSRRKSMYPFRWIRKAFRWIRKEGPQNMAIRLEHLPFKEFEHLLFKEWSRYDWHMTFCERAALLHVLRIADPEISIEIGTFRAGSLAPISDFSEKVFTFDIDPNHHRVHPQFSNVEFITGDTSKTLHAIVDQLNESDAEVNFILIDGSHETSGVCSDITECLRYIPKTNPTYIMMHDSSNPDVRAGILSAPWQDCSYVHRLDLDFVPGCLYDRPDIANQIWGGLALAVILPNRRVGDLPIDASFEYSRQAFLALIGKTGDVGD